MAADAGAIQAESREGFVHLLQRGLVECIEKHYGRHALPADDRAARKLEAFAFERTSGVLSAYVPMIRTFQKKFASAVGCAMSHCCAYSLLHGASTADEVLAARDYAPDQRGLSRAMLYRILEPVIGSEQAQETVPCIEQGCFNATIHRCQTSTSAPLRTWESPAFIDIYMTRVEIVARHLDPHSAVRREFPEGDATPLARLARGELTPERLGQMTEYELCPAAGADERATIAVRERQQIKEKTSSLYPCPNCRARDCTYRTVQIRSSDEADSVQCTCRGCGCNYQAHT